MGSCLTGVSKATMKNGKTYYRSSITIKKKHISLGSFSKEKEAHFAYLEAHKIMDSSLLMPEDYDNSHHYLSHDKWVSLCNLRDNGIYLKNPIYLRQHYFDYYLSSDKILKFDRDDLFYYATHKIMYRKGHLFVADYGMQVNILNRYQIKNYAVAGRDYLFINQDPNDYRHENIQIINRYHGVQRQQVKNKYKYITKIHIHGDYIVGKYNTEDEAAIAYNKAVDILKSKGLTKNFPTNYLDGLSPKIYADIYHHVSIADKIYEFQLKE